MKRGIALLVLALVLLVFAAAASWPSPGAAQAAAKHWVKVRLGLDATSVTCQLNHEHALCLVRAVLPPTVLVVDCLQEHLPDHYRCVLVDTL